MILSKDVWKPDGLPPGFFYAGKPGKGGLMPVTLNIDATEFNRTIDAVHSMLSEEKFERVMLSEFRRIQPKIKKVLKADLPEKYIVKAAEINSSVKKDQTQVGPGGVSTRIPIKGARRAIGGNHIKAKGGVRGWAAVRYAGRPYPITASILTGQTSVLPKYIKGGNAPFRNLSAKKLNGVAFYRKGKDRHPIMKISGIAVPQMPTNRSMDTVQNDIEKLLQERMAHVFNQVMAGVIKG